MGARRKSRELALQALYFLEWQQRNMPQTRDLVTETELRLRSFCSNFRVSETNLPFFLMLTRGVCYLRPQIDAVIERFSSHWKIHRMASVDRNILRMAVFEMCCRSDIPHTVSINEAVDLGKIYGTEESGAFINGILDSVRIQMESEPHPWIEIPEDILKRIEDPSLKPLDELLRIADMPMQRKPLTSGKTTQDDSLEETSERKPRRRKIVQQTAKPAKSATPSQR